ncbi:hypothetical protein [Paraburkholderia sp. SIMBA_054]|uniref:hypothetical protein n=1 Tax=Paraburkholderia sp. SIMBA_054 TaxID=3085795 RepID=UPI00397BCA44
MLKELGEMAGLLAVCLLVQFFMSVIAPAGAVSALLRFATTAVVLVVGLKAILKPQKEAGERLLKFWRAIRGTTSRKFDPNVSLALQGHAAVLMMLVLLGSACGLYKVTHFVLELLEHHLSPLSFQVAEFVHGSAFEVGISALVFELLATTMHWARALYSATPADSHPAN